MGRLWTHSLLRNPHAAADKRTRVQGMFSAIAGSYDLNNRVHSLGLDRRWRRTAVELSGLRAGESVVDVACGTGDLSLAFAAGGAGRVLGIDFTYGMLPLARAKRRRQAASADVPFVCGDAMRLPLPDGCADVVSIAFGIRNVVDPSAALAEFSRILRPGGRVVILEFSLPKGAVLRSLYNFYFRRILPMTATLLSADRSGAYRYLPESVNTFITPDGMRGLLASAGFRDVVAHRLSLGICVCYLGRKGG